MLHTVLTRIAKRKREEDKEKQEKINHGISKYFGAKNAAKAPKTKVCSQDEKRNVKLTLLARGYCCRPKLHG